MKHALTSRNWFGKASAGLLLGFLFALGMSGVLMKALGAADTFMSPKGQLTMWAIAPVWAGILSLVFLFRSGVGAWGWLTLANMLVWAPLVIGS